MECAETPAQRPAAARALELSGRSASRSPVLRRGGRCRPPAPPDGARVRLALVAGLHERAGKTRVSPTGAPFPPVRHRPAAPPGSATSPPRREKRAADRIATLTTPLPHGSD